MRNNVLLKALLVLVVSGYLTQISNGEEKLHGRLSLSGAFALYPMAVKWSEEFRKIHPDVKIDLSAGGAGKGMTDVLNGMVDLGMVSREVYPEEVKKGAVPFAVTKDAVVAVISSKSPVLNDVLTNGITAESAMAIWITGKAKAWSQVVKTSSKAPLHVYTRSDACGAAEVWAKWFGKKQEDLLGSGVFGDPGLSLAVSKDPVGIGYNNIGYAYDFKTKQQLPGIRIVPIDLNKNGKIDPDENFYGNMNDLIQAIAKGKYPSPPARDLYLVTKGKPNALTAAFLTWILSDGQRFVNESGYITLPKETIEKSLKNIK